MIRKILILFLLIFLIGCSNEILMKKVPTNEIILQSNEGSSAGASWGSTYTVTYENGKIKSIDVKENYWSVMSSPSNREFSLTNQGAETSEKFYEYAEKIMSRGSIEEKKVEVMEIGEMKSSELSDGRKCEYIHLDRDTSQVFCYKNGVLVTFIGRGWHGFVDYWRVRGHTWTDELEEKTQVGNWPNYSD